MPKTCQVKVNGRARTLDEGTTIAELVAQMRMGDRRIAIEVNREIVPRSAHAAAVLSEGDEVEIVHAVGGG